MVLKRSLPCLKSKRGRLNVPAHRLAGASPTQEVCVMLDAESRVDTALSREARGVSYTDFVA